MGFIDEYCEVILSLQESRIINDLVPIITQWYYEIKVPYPFLLITNNESTLNHQESASHSGSSEVSVLIPEVYINSKFHHFPTLSNKELLFPLYLHDIYFNERCETYNTKYIYKNGILYLNNFRYKQNVNTLLTTLKKLSDYYHYNNKIFDMPVEELELYLTTIITIKSKLNFFRKICDNNTNINVDIWLLNAVYFIKRREYCYNQLIL